MNRSTALLDAPAVSWRLVLLPVLLALCLCVTACGGWMSQNHQRGSGQEWTMGAGGDTQLARRTEQFTLEKGDFTYSFGDMTSFMKGLDLFFCNLECQIADRGEKMDKGESKPYHFRADPAMINALVQSGVDVVTIANNHGMDYGPQALLQTIELCRENGIVIVGGGRNATEAAAPGFIKAGGQRLAFVGFQSTSTQMGAGPDTPGVNALRYQESGHFLAAAQAALAKARPKADVVVFTVHWGPNYRKHPSKKERRIARDLLDMGFDVFIGHSAHQFLGVETHAGKPIIHDAGNFAVDFKPVAGQWNDRNMLFVLHFKGPKVEMLEAIPIHREGAVTNFAKGEVAKKTCERFAAMSAALGTTVEITQDNKAVISLR